MCVPAIKKYKSQNIPKTFWQISIWRAGCVCPLWPNMSPPINRISLQQSRALGLLVLGWFFKNHSRRTCITYWAFLWGLKYKWICHITTGLGSRGEVNYNFHFYAFSFTYISNRFPYFHLVSLIFPVSFLISIQFHNIFLRSFTCFQQDLLCLAIICCSGGQHMYFQ